LGLNAATTRNVISSTMAHLISRNNGSRFVFSHEFSDLLVGQMEATLEGQDIHERIRTSKVPGDELKCWSDSLADGYIHRPLQKDFEDICFYDMTSQYKKIYKSYKPKSSQTYEFSDSHPGYCWETPIHKAPCFSCAPARPNLYYRILTKANPCLLSKHLNR
jgi:hypothetical protein